MVGFMDAVRQWHEGLSVIGILFADSVTEGEAVEMRKRSASRESVEESRGDSIGD